jgi:hypothetical protein
MTLHDKIVATKEQNPEWGSIAIAKHLSAELKKTIDDAYVRNRLRAHKRKNNTFNKTLKENSFPDSGNWDYGWLKTKEASVFIRNSDKSVSYEQFREDFLADMKSYSPDFKKIKYRPCYDPHAVVIDIADLHIGKLSTVSGTGEHYDVNTALEKAVQGLIGVLEKTSGFQINQFVFVIGNDVLHTDTAIRTTTKGTPQDTSGMWYDNFVAARRLYTYCIEKLAELAPVHVVYNVSNHDVMSGFMLADSVSCFFAKHDSVTFDVSAQHRKYYAYGKNLIGFSHGDGAKMEQLPLLMANEEPMLWSVTKHRYVYLHHLHHKRQWKFHSGQDYSGVTVEYMRSPSATDQWHSKAGYQHAPKAIEAMVHHRDNGQVARISHLFN